MNTPHLLFLIDTFKIYISPRRLKGALRTMAYSAPAVHHRVPLVCVIEIAIVGKSGLQYLGYSAVFDRSSFYKQLVIMFHL